MKLKDLMEELEVLNEEKTETIQNGERTILFSEFSKNHIKLAHTDAGQGSFFTNIDTSKLAKIISKVNIPAEGGVVATNYPNAGYNLVMSMAEANKLPDAIAGTTKKQEGPNEVEVPTITTSAPLSEFKTSIISVVIRPTPAKFLPDDLKDDATIVQAAEVGNVYSVLSAWPGGEAPPASQWNGEYAVIIPKK